MQTTANNVTSASDHARKITFWRNCTWLKVLLVIGCFVYVLTRILKLPLGPDEWEVLKDVREHGFADWVLFLDWNSQNHLLNLLLAKLCYLISPRHELQMIRIPSLLALALYEWAAWRITQRLQSRFLSVAAFAALLVNAFVLDYFGLSRGYGLAIAFTLWSLSALLDLFQKPGRSTGAHWLAHLSAFTAFLAATSNLTYISLYATIFVLLILLWGKRWFTDPTTRLQSLVKNFVVDNLFLVAYSGILAGICLPRLVFLQRSARSLGGDQIVGGNSGLVTDTVSPLVESVFYDIKLAGYLAHNLAWVTVAVVLILGAISLIRRYLPTCRFKQSSKSLCMFLFLLIAVLGLVSLHVLLRAKYPSVSRVVLYIIPAFILQVAFFADEIPRWWMRILPVGILLVWIGLGLWNLNLTHTYGGEVDSDIPQLMRDLKSIHDQSGRLIVLCLSDGTKWNVWYYGEKTVGVKESERLREYYCLAVLDWLTVYETYCGRPHDGHRNFFANTTHFFIGPEDDPLDWIPADYNLGGGLTLAAKFSSPRLVTQYPLSKWRLYARE